MVSNQGRTASRLAAWLLFDFTFMLLSVYWLHTAYYKHQTGSTFLYGTGLAIWTWNFRHDIRRWTGPRK